MKVHIGKYPRYYSVNTIADFIIFWDNNRFSEKETLSDKFADFLDKSKILNRFIVWLNNRNKQKIYVKIEGHDVWSLDHTLSLIIFPALKKLKEVNCASPLINDSDVPDHLKSTSAPPLTEEQINSGFLDGNYHLRWEWILDEMIWTFEQYTLEDRGEDQFTSGKSDYIIENGKMEKGPNHTYEIDREAVKAHRARMENGMRLFAKYYEALWN